MLTWNDPEDPVEGETTEGFEAYEPLQSASWANGLSSTTTAVSHTLSATAAAHRETMNIPTPAHRWHSRYSIPAWQASHRPSGLPYLGNQMAVCFDAAERDNDDWLISPEVKGGTKGELRWPAASLPTMDSRSSTSATLQPTLKWQASM